VISAAPSLGASAGAIDGGAIASRGRPSVWGFAGVRGASREAIGGAGVGIGLGATRVSAAIGVAESARAGSITLIRRDRGRSAAVEALGSSGGRALLAEVAARGDAMLLSARWRYRSWSPGKVAAELAAETLGSDSRARISWRSWSGGALLDDGLLELEAAVTRRGSAPVRMRLGAAGFGRAGERAGARQGYGLFDATLARDEKRSLGLHVIRRASAGAGSRASSTTVGTRLDVRAGRIGEHSLLVETTRLRRGASAWGVGLTPSGETTLRARSRTGMWVAARGGFGARLLRFGYALERGEDERGPRPWSGTVWVRLDRD